MAPLYSGVRRISWLASGHDAMNVADTALAMGRIGKPAKRKGPGRRPGLDFDFSILHTEINT